MDFILLLYEIKNYEYYLYEETKNKSIFRPINRYELLTAANIYCNNIDNNKMINNDISLWDVSNITNMNNLFSHIDINIPIYGSSLPTSFFYKSKISYDISDWDVNNVIDMSHMFSYNNFNGDISNWDVSNVTDMNNMFKNCTFNGNISYWNVSKVMNMTNMFNSSLFEGDISKWDISNILYVHNMFYDCGSNIDISLWNICCDYNISSLITDSYIKFDNFPTSKLEKNFKLYDNTINDVYYCDKHLEKIKSFRKKYG